MTKVYRGVLAGAGALVIAAGMFVDFAAPASAATPPHDGNITLCADGDYNAKVEIVPRINNQDIETQTGSIIDKPGGDCAKINMADSSITDPSHDFTIRLQGDFGDGFNPIGIGTSIPGSARGVGLELHFTGTGGRANAVVNGTFSDGGTFQQHN